MGLLGATRIAPVIDGTNRPFWTGGERGLLLIERCSACARWQHPPQGRCGSCSGPVNPERASGRGTVLTFTINRHPYNPEVEVPYVIAIVELEEQAGLRFTTNIVGCEPEAVFIGMSVTVDFQPAGEGWAPVFRPGSRL